MVVDERVNGSSIQLHIGADLELRLAENSTTGFHWILDAAGAPMLAVRGDRYEAPAPAAPGAGGVHVWQFQAQHTGMSRVDLSYRRRSGGEGKTFTLAVEIRD